MGLGAGGIIAPLQLVSTRLPFCITVLKDKDALRRAKVDLKGLSGSARCSRGLMRMLMEPFLVTLSAATAA